MVCSGGSNPPCALPGVAGDTAAGGGACAARGPGVSAMIVAIAIEAAGRSRRAMLLGRRLERGRHAPERSLHGGCHRVELELGELALPADLLHIGEGLGISADGSLDRHVGDPPDHVLDARRIAYVAAAL